MFTTSGIVFYRDTTCIVLVDPEIVKYYFSLIPKYYNANRQKYDPHITVIRKFEKPNGYISLLKNVKVQYSGVIHYAEPYFFLNCWSKEISEIREKSGLKRYRFGNCYHITIGNTK